MATTTANPADVTAAAADAMRRLKALRAGVRANWYTILGGDPASGAASRWALMLASTGQPRELYRDEVLPWLRGYADAAGQSGLISGLAVDELISIEDAAAMLGISVDAVKIRIKARPWEHRRTALYPIHIEHRVQRQLLRAQVEATLPVTGLRQLARRGPVPGDRRITAAVADLTGLRGPIPEDELAAAAAAEVDRRLAARAEWEILRDDYPVYERLDQLSVYTGPLPSPDPLPVPPVSPAVTDTDRRLIALGLAGARGLCTYLWHDPEVGRYAVRTPARRLPRTLLPAEVLPWILGVADHAGRGREVAYRPGLG